MKETDYTESSRSGTRRERDVEEPFSGLSGSLLLAVFLVYAAMAFGMYYHGLASPMLYDSKAFILDKGDLFARGGLLEVMRIIPVRPLFMTTLYLNYVLTGMDPEYFRLFNILLVAATGVVLVELIRMVLDYCPLPQSVTGRDKLVVSIFLGLLFVVHPLQRLVIMYIWQREAIMACFFYLAALTAYVAGRSGRLRSPGVCYAATGLLFLAGMLSKENVASLPIVLVLTELVFFKQSARQLASRVVAIACITAPVAIAYLAATKSLHATQSLVRHGILDRLNEYVQHSSLTIGEMVLTESRVFFSHVLNIVAPFWSGAPLIDVQTISRSLWDPPITLAASLGGLALIALAIGFIRRTPVFSFGLLFFVVTILPESVLIPQYLFFGYRAILPMTGLLMIAAAALMYLRSWPRWAFYGAWFKPAAASVAVAVLAVYGATTVTMAGNWKSIDFWENSFKRLPPLSSEVELRPWLDVLLNYSAVLIDAKEYDKVINVHARTGVMDTDTFRSLAGSEADSRLIERIEAANAEFNKLVKQFPDKAAEIIVKLGLALHARGRLPLAISQYQRALELNPDLPSAYNNLGFAYEKSGDVALALDNYTKAWKLAPSSPVTNFNLANALVKSDRVSESISFYVRTIRLAPGFAQAYAKLGEALLKSRRFAEAESALRKAVSIDRFNAEYYNALAMAYAAQGKEAEAREMLAKALALKPDHPEARRNMERLTGTGDQASDPADLSTWDSPLPCGTSR